MAIEINTAVVQSTATQIAAVNRSISNDFSIVTSAISNLNKTWSGDAADLAANRFRSIRNAYYDNRYTVIDDMVRYMNNQVSTGYEEAEKAVSSVASAFK